MWYYNRKPFDKELIPEGAVGFIYVMRLTIDGEEKLYIGKKAFYSVQKIKLGKKEEALRTDKRLKQYKVVSKLNYENYYSSNAKIKEAVKNKVPVMRVILKICYSKTELTYEEVKYQFKFDVLGSDRFLNDNILGKFYRKGNEKISKIL
jgi:hypothetical protein